MALNVNRVADEVKFVKRKFGNIENPAQNENPSVWFSIEELEEQIVDCWGNEDTQYIEYITGQHELFVQDVGKDPQLEFSIQGAGYDPQYALFLSNLEKDGSSYVLQANEKTGLSKSLRYEEYESDDEGQEVSDSLPKTQRREPEIDNDYAFFYDNLRVEGSNVICQIENYPPVVYDSLDLPKIDSGASSREQKSKHSINFMSSDSSEEESSSPFGSSSRKIRSKFRMRIMRILSMPYDKEEHKELMNAISEKKPQYRHIDLRSGGVRFYASNKMGKSLLDQHWNLKQKVKAAAKDDFKQLNLLRGFFFWLQNLTREGSFMPWNDSECLAVRPQAC